MDFIITTSPLIEGHYITEYLGPVISNEVLGVNIISDSIASILDIFGGSSGTYRNKLDDLKIRVLGDLRNQAIHEGADAIVGLNISFNEISGKGKQMFMATAIGTAVKLGYDRLDFARKMHELMTFHTEGIFTDAEFDHEVILLKNSVENTVAKETNVIEEYKKGQEEAKKRAEIEQAESLKRIKEADAKKEAERLEYINKHSEILQVIDKEFTNHKDDIKGLDVERINNATYDDILPKETLTHYDTMRYFVALGRADAAAKYYIDTFKLSADDALEYLLSLK